MKTVKKNIKVLSWLNTGIFPATIMFSMNFKHTEIIKSLEGRSNNTSASDWLAGIEGEEKLINEGWCALRRDLENTKTGENKTLFYINLNTPFDFSDYDYCKLAHEVLHITQFMLKDFLARDREFECEAYLHTHIMQQCLKTIRG